jgi:hypothetical protein
MIHQNKYAAAMSEKTVKELIRIIKTDTDNYVPEAIAAAEDELKNRNLSVEDKKKAIKNNAFKAFLEKRTAKKKAEEPLDMVGKIFIFFFPLEFSFNVEEGYTRKQEELMYWRFFGITFYSVLILIFVYFK